MRIETSGEYGWRTDLYDDVGDYWIPDRDTDEYRTALACIRLRKDGHSWRDIARETSLNKDTARPIYARRERYLPPDSTERSPIDERVDTTLETVR